MKIEIFNSLWLTAFGWGLSDSTGLAEWRRLVDWEAAKRDDKYPLRNDKYTRRTLDIYAEQFSRAKNEGKSNYRDNIPTVKEFRNRYFAMVPQFQREAAIAQSGDKICRHCGGDGHVWGVVDQKGHEDEAPEHVMEIPAERLPFIYYGVQAYDCPVCRAAAYRDDAYRQRVMRNCLPEVIPVGDPANPHDYPECGERVLLDVLKARIDAAKGAPARVVDAPGVDNLEAMFPLHSAVKTQIDIDEEERRITAEMAGKFGPQ